jgi:hypothetical protein
MTVVFLLLFLLFYNSTHTNERKKERKKEREISIFVQTFEIFLLIAYYPSN